MLIGRTCEYCGRQFYARSAYVKRGGARFCSHWCNALYRKGKPTQAFSKRFWSRVRIPDNINDCWLWQGYIKLNGYGSLSMTTTGINSAFAHRLAYELMVGPIPEGMNVCHHCDIRHCVNPSHLYIGTQSDNLKDMARKGRMFFQKHPEQLPRGIGHGMAKLNDQLVLEIRRRYASEAISQDKLAAEYGLGQSTISSAIRGKTWAHV